MTLTVKSVVVAEDVRKEISGKDIIIGAFGGDIIVSAIPSPIEIALWIELQSDGGSPNKGELVMHIPNGALDPLRMNFESDMLENGCVSLSTPKVGTIVTEAGDLVVFLKPDGADEPIEIVRKAIRLGNIPPE